jgi:hypothetical protein
MRQWAVLHVRFVTFSVASLGLAACAKLAPTAAASARPEPRLGDPSVELAVTDADRLEALQGQVEALETEIAALRKALDVMGPLATAEDGLVAIAGADVAGEIPTTDPATEAAARLARLYAPPPSFARARSLFYEAELGAYRSRDAAEAGWRRLAGDKSLAGLDLIRIHSRNGFSLNNPSSCCPCCRSFVYIWLQRNSSTSATIKAP